jgi:hypothetical protein
MLDPAAVTTLVLPNASAGQSEPRPTVADADMGDSAGSCASTRASTPLQAIWRFRPDLVAIWSYMIDHVFGFA